MKQNYFTLIFIFSLILGQAQVVITKPAAILAGHEDEVICVALSPSGKYIATGSWDHNINLYSTDSFKLIRTLKGHATVVNSLAFNKDSKYLVSTSNDH